MLVRTCCDYIPSTIRLPSSADSSNEITIGRHQSTVDVWIDDRRNENVISRLHARIIRHDQPNRQTSYEIVSVGTNGIAVNGTKIANHRLIDGDEISFAPAARYPTELVYLFKLHPDSHPSISLSNSPSFNRIINQAGNVNTTLQKHVFNSVSSPSILARQSLNLPINHSMNALQSMPHPTPQLVKQSTEPIFDECGNYDRVDDKWQKYWVHDEKSDLSTKLPNNQLMDSESAVPYSLDPDVHRPATPALNSVPSVDYSMSEVEADHSSTQSATQPASWNLRFQTALSEPEDTPEQVMSKYALLSRLNTDFVTLARNYGRTIISEYFLPSRLQTIPFDRMMGGFAGGRKYTVRGIMFKLCTDIRVREDKWLYGGDQPNIECANKAGANELRAAVNCFPFHTIGVHVPIIACVEYAGFRLLAMPVLPLRPNSQPIYGSSDSGQTVHAEDAAVNSLMSHMATELHWAPHHVNGRLLYSAGDVEGHRGEDNRYYVIDLARCFPPENPFDPVGISQLTSQADDTFNKQTVNSQSVFYAQLRPELLQILRLLKRPALSADAFTRWGITDSERLNADVRSATDFMRADRIAALAKEWCTGVKCDVIKQVMMDEQDQNRSFQPMPDQPVDQSSHLDHHVASFQADEELRSSERNDSLNSTEIRHYRLSEELHLHGINVRHLGILRYHILHNQSVNQSTDYHQANKMAQLLLVEMISRALKNLLRAELRDCMQKVNNAASSAEFDSLRCIVNFLNRITGADQSINQPIKIPHKRARKQQTQDCDEFWTVTLVEAIKQRFGDCALRSEDDQITDLQDVTSNHLIRIIGYICLCCGIALSPSCEQSFSMSPHCFTFTVVDCELRATVESMPIIDYAEVRLLMAQSQQHRAKALPIINQTISQSNKRKRARSVDPSLMKLAINSLSTSCRLLSLAVQLFDRLRHALPFNSRFKSEARSGRALLKQQQNQLTECDQQIDHDHISQSQQLSQSQQSGPSLSQTALICTGLSTGFARFAVSSQTPAYLVNQSTNQSNLHPVSASHSFIGRTHSHVHQLAPPPVLQSPVAVNQSNQIGQANKQNQSHHLSPHDTTFSLALSLDPTDDDEIIDNTEVLPFIMSIDPAEDFTSPVKSTDQSTNQSTNHSANRSTNQTPTPPSNVSVNQPNLPVIPLRRSDRTKSRVDTDALNSARMTRSRSRIEPAQPVTNTSPQSIRPKRRRLKKLGD